jgi:aminoglycoside phosphotransferase (APT) family kinase protein
MTEMKNCIQDFIQRQYPSRAELKLELSEMNQGWETELKRLTMEYKLGEEYRRTSQVIRIYADSNGAEKAKKEFHVMRQLNKIGYPVPEVYLIESTGQVIGKPFITMELIDGENYFKNFTSEEKEEKASITMMKLLARLHEVNPLLIYPEMRLPTTYESVKKYTKFHQLYYQKTKNTFLIPVMNWVEKRIPLLRENKPCLIHGDYHANNLILRKNGKLVVIDWGAANIGDPREDLSWTMLLHSIYDKPQAGTKLLKAYKEVSKKPVENIDFFMVTSIIRRLLDLATSIHSGTNAIGLRKDTLELMRSDKQNYLRAYNMLMEITGLELEELYNFLNTL